VQHAPEFIQTGGRDRQLRALKNLDQSDFNGEDFTSADLAVINLSIEMTRFIRVSDSTMEALKTALENDRQVMELIGIVATYNMVSRYLVALGIELEGEEEKPASPT
jgi:alkylhydroperoxidase family enzyme